MQSEEVEIEEEPYKTLYEIVEILVDLDVVTADAFHEALLDLVWDETIYDRLKDLVPKTKLADYEHIKNYIQDVRKVDLGMILNKKSYPFGIRTAEVIVNRIREDGSSKYIHMFKDKLLEMLIEDEISADDIRQMAIMINKI